MNNPKWTSFLDLAEADECDQEKGRSDSISLVVSNIRTYEALSFASKPTPCSGADVRRGSVAACVLSAELLDLSFVKVLLLTRFHQY